MRELARYALAAALGIILVAFPAGAARLELSTGVLVEHTVPWDSAYEDGWFIGVGSSFELTRDIDIIVGGSYRHHGYVGGVRFGFAQVPEYHYSHTVVGNDSHSYEMHVGARVLGGRQGFRPTAALRAGAIVLDLGEIQWTEQIEEIPDYERTIVLQHTGQRTASLYLSLAFGVTAPIGSTGRLIVEGSVSATSEPGYVWIPLELRVQF